MRSALLPGIASLAALMLPTITTAISNDECADATTLVVAGSCTLTAGSWTDATQSLAPITCSGSTAVTANDAWYAFTAMGEHSVVTVQSDTANDAVLEVFIGNCSALISIACADATLNGGAETVTINTAPGVTYYIRTYWWDYGTTPSSLDFGICVVEGPPSPVNDHCGSVGAVAIPIGTTQVFSGTTVGADSLGDHASGSVMDAGNASVWHAFTTAECSQLRISYCGTVPAFENTWSLLAMSCPADSVVFADVIDLSECGNGNVTLSFDSLPAGTWYLPVLSDPSLANGPYEVTVAVNSCATGVANLPSASEWTAFVQGDGLVVLPGSPGTAVIELFETDGRLVWRHTVAGTPGIPILLPMRGNTAGVRLVRISTSAGRNTLPLLRQIP